MSTLLISSMMAGAEVDDDLEMETSDVNDTLEALADRQ